MTGENRRANALAELASARDALRAADALARLRLLRDAMSRTYYAAFHAARALLLLEGVEPKTHAGVARLVGELLVRSGKLEPRVHRSRAGTEAGQAPLEAAEWLRRHEAPPSVPMQAVG